jgi:predicted O-methyltransferase YrrM
MRRPRPTKRKRWHAILDRLPKDRSIVGAEIGVLNARTARELLQHRPLLTHIMIDPWEVPEPGSSYALEADTNAQKSQAEHNKAYLLTKQRTAFAGKRAIIKKMYSAEAVEDIKDGSLDFVFIDGDHSYAGCSNDIKLWKSKVKKGGWIGGHDYAHPKLPGVKKAVDEAFPGMNIQLDDNRTWFVWL